ncbi:MAG: sensor histidine kinase [Candidatus Promineofilum sp.]|nr:sensor histidine kinase [Promineifilum sp.]MCW5861910.1 sensor histidine kinase [Anaerolineae bacterium]
MMRSTALSRLSLTQQFMIASLIILVAAALGLGRWAAGQIEQSVVSRTAETTALFVDSFIAPNLQELSTADTLTPDHIATLDRLLDDTPLGRQILSFKVWDAGGKVLYSAEPAAIGQVFPVGAELTRAWSGAVSSDISDLEDAENVLERTQRARLLETYAPVRLENSDEIIAVAEFYQTVDELERDIALAQGRTWLVVGASMLVIYLLLAGFVGRAGDTIDRQQAALSRQVAQLTDLLGQNEALHQRVQRAAARTTALNERVLRRISAELHDGPVQDIGLALLRLDNVVAQVGDGKTGGDDETAIAHDLDMVQTSMQRALLEIRALSSGMGVPQLSELTLPETLARAVRVHQQRSGTVVTLALDGTPERASLPVKITLYRLVQEALHNAYRHAGGIDQRVTLCYDAGRLHVEVADGGAGFGRADSVVGDDHLGLAGMRERVESLGGNFRVESAPGQGTRVIADLSLAGEEEAP